jgi:uncharacterized membrane protein YhaH (DUF805 family)
MKLLSIKGRVSRKTFWIFYGILVVGLIITSIIDSVISGQAYSGDMGYLGLIFAILMFWPFLAVQVKRWHDCDKSGLWVLINLVPIIGSIYSLIMNGFIKGTEGHNRYGDNPL